MDELTKQVLNKPCGARSILTVSDGVLKGSQVRQMAADFRAQETIRETTERILRENGVYEELAKQMFSCAAGCSSRNKGMVAALIYGYGCRIV